MNKQLSPNFDSLDPNGIIDHIQTLAKKSIMSHSELIPAMLEQIEPEDFLSIAYPKAKSLIDDIATIQKELFLYETDDQVNTSDKESKQERLKALEIQISKLKLSPKHLIILSIENIIAIANANQWGLSKRNNFIYLYNGAFWSEVDKENFQKFLGSAAEKMGVAKLSVRYFQFREQLFKQFLSEAYFPIPANNNKKILINLRNGTFEISSTGGKLRNFNQSDFITYQLPFDYDPNAMAPTFIKYLNKVLPDKERQKILAEYLGYVFICHGSKLLKEEKALILYGSGANGKSVFFEIVHALLGSENVSSYSLQSLTNENGYYRAKIGNKLVNYASEINGKLQTSIFKQLVSGEPVEARLPYGEPFILHQYAKLIFNCNELPKEVEHTPAYFRRFLIIPFDVAIPEQEQDKNLHTKIIESELSGVFNWVLSGLDRLLKQQKFSKCDATDKALERYKIESDSVLMFLSDYNYDKSTGQFIRLSDMYFDYKTYCQEGGFRVCNVRTFADRLRHNGYSTDRKNFGMAVFAEKMIIEDGTPDTPDTL